MQAKWIKLDQSILYQCGFQVYFRIIAFFSICLRFNFAFDLGNCPCQLQTDHFVCSGIGLFDGVAVDQAHIAKRWNATSLADHRTDWMVSLLSQNFLSGVCVMHSSSSWFQQNVFQLSANQYQRTTVCFFLLLVLKN